MSTPAKGIVHKHKKEEPTPARSDDGKGNTSPIYCRFHLILGCTRLTPHVSLQPVRVVSFLFGFLSALFFRSMKKGSLSFPFLLTALLRFPLFSNFTEGDGGVGTGGDGGRRRAWERGDPKGNLNSRNREIRAPLNDNTHSSALFFARHCKRT